MLKWTALALVLGFFIDLLVGDPRWLYHPVRIIGKGISFLEACFRRWFPKTQKGERIGGFLLVIFICAGSAAIPLAILYVAYKIHTLLGIGIETFFCYQMLAVKSLKQESMRVFEELEKGDLKGARYAVSMIVGRDTQSLDEIGVTKAAVETVAENTSDGIIAPLFYMAIGGPVLMFFYKGVNTMDSMVGYKNEKYLYFGRAAARLDDLVNYIPSRISAWLMICAAFIGGKSYSGRQAYKIYKRDNRKHASPNSAQTESVCAGALGIRLAGDACYFGKTVKKPFIGDACRSVEYEDIKRVNKLMYITAWLCEMICLTLMAGLICL